MAYKRVAQLRTYEQFVEYCALVGAELPVDDVALSGEASPLARSYKYRDRVARQSLCCAADGGLGWHG